MTSSRFITHINERRNLNYKNQHINILILACKRGDQKAQQTEKRNVGTYDGIHIAGSYKVTLISGAEGTIELKGDEEDLERIASNVKN